MMNPFEELLGKLARAKVRFVLVGGCAVVMQGHWRNTGDLDIVVESTAENAHRLIDALSQWGEGLGSDLTVDEIVEPQIGAIRIIEEFPLDVFTLMRARTADREFTYRELAEDADRFELPGGATFLSASLSRLIDLKAGTGRPKDQIDLETLREIESGLRQRAVRKLPAPMPEARDGAISDQGEWPT